MQHAEPQTPRGRCAAGRDCGVGVLGTTAPLAGDTPCLLLCLVCVCQAELHTLSLASRYGFKAGKSLLWGGKFSYPEIYALELVRHLLC